MSQEHAAVARQTFKRICRRDIDGLLDLYDAEIEFLPLTGTRVESGGYVGHAGVRDYFAEADEVWEEMQPHADDVRTVGDDVVILGGCAVRGRGSGARSDSPMAWVLTMRRGKVIRHRGFATREEALRAAGLTSYTVSAENVELVRRFYAALNANDLGSVRALCDDAIEYVNPEAATEPGTRIGPEAFRAAFEGLHANFEGFRCEPEQITPFGDTVVVVARSTGVGRLSEIPFSEVHGHLLALRGGRIASFRWFQTVQEAYAAAPGATRADHERSFRRGLEAYSRGDYEAAVEGFHPDIEWSAETDLVPDAEVYRGHEGVRRFWAIWAEVIEGMTLEIEECRAVDDDQVLAVTRASGTGAGSGASVASGRFAQLAEFREGMVVRVRLFGDVKRAFAAAGLD